MSGPMRSTWIFPKRAQVLIDALEERQKLLVEQMDEKISAEMAWNRDVDRYREALREIGVVNWEHALPENNRDLSSRAKVHQSVLARDLEEVRLYKAALTDDQKLDPHRLYKLAAKDLEWFGLSD